MFCEKEGKTMLVASVDRLARNESFSIDFGGCDFRGDFDVEIIVPETRFGYVEIEKLAFSVILNKEN